MDALQDRLLQARATGALFAQSAANPPWGLRLPDDTQLAVHAMVDGTAWLWFDDPDQAIELRVGDVALVRGPRVHHLGSAPGESRVDLGGLPPVSVRDGQPTVRILNDPHPTDVFLCGAYQPLTVEDIAAHARLSSRTLHRRFQEQTGTAPLQWVTQTRVRQAQALLESTSYGVERIAHQTGFGSATNLRAKFRATLGTSPAAYRNSFGGHETNPTVGRRPQTPDATSTRGAT